LCLRRALSSVFVGGSYVPLRARGRAHKYQHVAAFARQAEGNTLVIAAPLLVAALLGCVLTASVGEDVWRNDWLTVPLAGEYRDVLGTRTLQTHEQGGKPALL